MIVYFTFNIILYNILYNFCNTFLFIFISLFSKQHKYQDINNQLICSQKSLYMPLHFFVQQIHQSFLSLLQLTNKPLDMLIKPFIRYYVQKQLIKRQLDKSQCLSYDIAMLTNQIKKKFGASFQFQNKTHKRHNQYYLYGLRFPPQLQQQHEQYKLQYIENRKKKYRQASEEKIYQNQIRKYLKTPQPCFKYITTNSKGKQQNLQMHSETGFYSMEKRVLLDPMQIGRMSQTAMKSINLSMKPKTKIRYYQEYKQRENNLIERVKELQQKVRRLQKMNKFLMKQMENGKYLKQQLPQQNQLV